MDSQRGSLRHVQQVGSDEPVSTQSPTPPVGLGDAEVGQALTEPDPDVLVVLVAVVERLTVADVAGQMAWLKAQTTSSVGRCRNVEVVVPQLQRLTDLQPFSVSGVIKNRSRNRATTESTAASCCSCSVAGGYLTGPIRTRRVRSGRVPKCANNGLDRGQKAGPLS